jgi:hypothetical protein
MTVQTTRNSCEYEPGKSVAGRYPTSPLAWSSQ